MLNANVKELVQFEKEPQIYPKQITKLSINREWILLHSPPKNELGCILSHPNLSHPEKDSWLSGKLEQMSSLFFVEMYKQITKCVCTEIDQIDLYHTFMSYA